MSYNTYKKKQDEMINYVPSVDVQNAKKKRDTALASDPRNNAQFGAMTKEYLDRYLNRKDFTYDANMDPLYKQYAEAYKRNGNTAMRDTMANAATLSGGFSNSFAQTAGQQQYNQYMTALNDKIPELYAMAYDKYINEGNDLLNKYNLLNTNDRQAIEDFYTNADFHNNLYQQEFGNDYGMFGDTRSYLDALASREQSDYWNQQQLDNDNYWREVERNDANYWNQQQLNEEQRQFDAKLNEESYNEGYEAAQEEYAAKNGKTKAVTQAMYADALKAYNEGGPDALAEWYDSAADLYAEEDLDAIIAYVAKYKDNPYDRVTEWLVNNR